MCENGHFKNIRKKVCGPGLVDSQSDHQKNRVFFLALTSKTFFSFFNKHLKKFKQGTKIFKYCTCPAGQETNNFYSSCKHMHLSFNSICNKEHKRVICNITSLSNSFQSTGPTGRVLWEE